MQRVLILLAILTSLSACTVGPNYAPPQDLPPDAWLEFAVGPTSRPDTSATGPTSRPASVLTRGPIPVAWWTTFHDPKLDDLIIRAARSNLDLKRAQTRILQARAQRRVTAADAYPEVNASGSYTHSRSGFGGASGSSGSGTSGGGGAAGGEDNLFQAGFDASWEVDVFGKVRRSIEAADADIQAAIEDRRDVMVSLLAEVARNYVELRGFQQQTRIARENLVSQRETLGVTKQRLERGLATSLDTARAMAQVSTTASQIPSLDASARQAAHRLAVLLGLQPQALADELLRESVIPTPPLSVPVGIPAELLRRRPDIRRAERQLAALTARVGVATADLYPRFSLTGSLGLSSADFGSLLNYASRVYSIGPSISWPLFDAGRIRANIEVTNAQQEGAMLAYQQTVLAAYRDVEDALIMYTRELERRNTLASAAVANQQATNLANELYTAGRTDFLSVLQAQRDLFQSQDALVQSDRLVSSNLIALYKALGGGWEIESSGANDAPAR